MPWSVVSRVATDKGWLYLKQMAPLFAHEPQALRLLHALIEAAPVPICLAHAPELRAFLMPDSGVPLRPLLKERYEAGLMQQALQLCATLQRNCIAHQDTMLTQGLPDQRLARLPELLAELLADDSLMRAESISPHERSAFLRLLPAVAKLGEELASCGVPETLEHGDFHDNNVLMQNSQLTINDWGDASLSHPFFSLASCLESSGRNHGLKPGDRIYTQLIDAYLASWLDYADNVTLHRSLDLALQLRPIHFAVNYRRLAKNVAYQPDDYYAGWIAKRLRDFVSTLNDFRQ